MKVSIRNFGPIAECELDFSNDFVLIVGENNVGKSYAISLAYLVIKTLGKVSSSFLRFESQIEFLSTWFAETAKRLQASESIDFDVTKDLESHCSELLRETFIEPLTESLFGTFGEVANLQNRFSSNPLSIRIQNSGISVELGIETEHLTIRSFDIGTHFLVRRVKATRTYKEVGKDVVIYFPEENPNQFATNYVDVLRIVFGAFTSEFRKQVLEVHYLPASRSGLYQALSAFGQIIAELSKSRSFLSKAIQLPGIAEPLSDYFLKLSNIRSGQSEFVDSPFTKIAKTIESEILHGEVQYDQKTKRLSFKPNDIDLTLELAATSSMVSEISPIVSYLKHVLPRAEGRRRIRVGNVELGGAPEGSKQMIMIEEPEAHLHPENQIRLVTALACLVREANCKVVLTTHSNYVFNKISNLVIDEQINRSRFSALLAASGRHGSTLRPIEVSDLGIADENFVDVSQKLFDEKVALLARRK